MKSALKKLHVDRTDRSQGSQHLQEAASEGNIENVKNLLKKKADVNYQDKNGWTALQIGYFVFISYPSSISCKLWVL
jgi:ankyrin repeat protein